MLPALLWCGVLAANAQTGGSSSCAVCHQSIAASYSRTPMALSSGVVKVETERLNGAGFSHRATGYRYRVRSGEGSLWLEIEKGEERFRRGLSYYVGSGATARSYLLRIENYLYEAPAAYYAAGNRWDFAPGYGGYAYPYLTRPVMPGCLNCHATGIALVEGTQNRYGDVPFREPGIGCERCHGPGAAHAARMKAGNQKQRGSGIINPAKLAPDRRDSICDQCHLLGEVRVMRAGKDWRSYQPGDRLSDSMTVFLRAEAPQQVTSHSEKLAQSRCKQNSGTRLWCGSCHDPHSVPGPTERVGWFRARCLACHEEKQCRASASARRQQSGDCTSCHMPKSTVTDAQHVVYTDHSIRKRQLPVTASTPGMQLRPIAGAASGRDMALATAIAASRQGANSALRAQAVALLEDAEKKNPRDVEVLVYLGERYREAGKRNEAMPLYARVLELDAANVTALAGMGAVLMERGEAAAAIRSWQDALRRNPGLMLVHTNLALAYLRLGDRQRAREVLAHAVDLNPGFSPALDLLRRLGQ